MSWFWQSLAVPCIFVLVLLAGARFGVPSGSQSEFGQLVCMLIPLLAMVLVCFRMPSALPSIAVFLFGIVMGLASQEPFGYWPLVLLVGTALAKLHPQETNKKLLLRLVWLAVVAAGLLCSFVIIESLYFLSMPEFGSFLGAIGVFLVTGWGLEMGISLLGMVRLQVSDSSRLVRGES